MATPSASASRGEIPGPCFLENANLLEFQCADEKTHARRRSDPLMKQGRLVLHQAK